MDSTKWVILKKCGNLGLSESQYLSTFFILAVKVIPLKKQKDRSLMQVGIVKIGRLCHSGDYVTQVRDPMGA